MSDRPTFEVQTAELATLLALNLSVDIIVRLGAQVFEDNGGAAGGRPAHLERLLKASGLQTIVLRGLIAEVLSNGHLTAEDAATFHRLTDFTTNYAPVIERGREAGKAVMQMAGARPEGMTA